MAAMAEYRDSGTQGLGECCGGCWHPPVGLAHFESAHHQSISCLRRGVGGVGRGALPRRPGAVQVPPPRRPPRCCTPVHRSQVGLICHLSRLLHPPSIHLRLRLCRPRKMPTNPPPQTSLSSFPHPPRATFPPLPYAQHNLQLAPRPCFSWGFRGAGTARLCTSQTGNRLLFSFDYLA